MAEHQRLAALRSYGVLDTLPEESFERLTQLAAELFEAPIALVSLLDENRQWFKSRHGLDAPETPRAWAICEHTIATGPGGTFVVEDATSDLRFASNPLVTGAPDIRFYAGAALTTPEGHNLGALCVIDTKPRRTPSAGELRRLQTLARMVVAEFELRKSVKSAEERARLLSLAETMAGVGHWRLDFARSEVTWSDEVYQIHGVERGGFNPNVDDALAFFAPEDRGRVAGLLARARTTGEGYEFQLRLNRADGEVRHVVCRAECERDDRGAAQAIFGVFQDVTTHVRALEAAERERRRAEEESRRAAVAEDLAGLGHWRVDLATGTLTWSDQMYAIYGLEREEAISSEKILGMVHPEDLTVTRERLDRDLAGEDAGERPLIRIVRKDGAIRWVVGNARVEVDADGRPSALVGTLMDVTRQTEAANALAESEARFKLLANNANDIVTKCGLDGRFRYVSPAIERITGYAPEEVVGREALEFVHPDDRERVRAEITEGLRRAGGREIEHRHVTKDGRVIWIQSRPSLARNAAGEAVAVTDVMRDVTAHKEAEAALVRSEARYRLLADNATDLVLRINRDGVIEYASPASRLLGYAPEELVGMRRLDLVHPDDRDYAVRLVADLVAGEDIGRRTRREYRFRHRDGRYLWLEGNPKLIRTASGEPEAVVSAFRDVSLRRALEDRLEEARLEAEAATAVKSEFVANMSHEIRTPLTAIIGFTGLLEERRDLPEPATAMVRRVRGASSALLSIVNDVLDFSKLEAEQMTISPRPVDVVGLAEEALQMFEGQAAEKSLELALEAEPDVPHKLETDPDRLRQILLNLLGNALKFTDAGAVRLKLRYDHGGEALHVRVEDTGAGMDEAQRARLFQRFSQVDASSTRRHGGTGLGLAICKGLTEALGGSIAVDSVPGEGSVFRFFVTAPPVADAPSEIAGEAPASSLSGLRVLVADDNPANRELARALLERFEVEVTDAADGTEAVTRAMEAPFDVLLIDLHMPVLDGLGALKRIRGQRGPNQDVPILAFTADLPEMTPLGPDGFDGVVAKPVTSKELAKALAEATDWRAPEAEPEALRA